MIEWKTELVSVPSSGSVEIDEAARRSISDSMNSLVEQSIMGAITSNAAPAEPPKQLTLKSLAQSMAEATFDAAVIISDYVPATHTEADGTVTETAAYVIDNAALPDWDIRCLIARARGEPKPKAKTIVFPSAEKALEAVGVATSGKR